MTSTHTPLIVKITKHLPLIEKLFLATFILGTVLRILHIDATVLGIALSGLAATFFLMAYTPSDISVQEGEQLGFQELLGLMIIPKVLWISTAISTLGVAFYLFHLEGYKKLLLIGGSTIGIATFLWLILLVSGMKYVKTVTQIFIRAVPLFLVDMYVLFL